MEDEKLEKTKWGHYWDRPSARSPEERDERYQDWLLRHGKPRSDKVIESGKRTWFESPEERRERFDRRYVQPKAPEGLSRDLSFIRGDQT